MIVAVVAAGAGVIVPTVCGCLEQQQQTTQMMTGITTKSTKFPTVTPTIMPTMLTTPRGLEWVILPATAAADNTDDDGDHHKEHKISYSHLHVLLQKNNANTLH